MIRCVTICHYVSLRGKRNFRLTWQSRGSALIKFFTAYHPYILENVPPTYLHDKTNYSNHYPDNRLAIATPRTFDTRSAQSNNVIVGSRLNAPTLRCRCVTTTRLQPFRKDKKIIHPPLTVTELKFEISDIRLYEIDFVD